MLKTNVPLDTIRQGVSLLSGVLIQADKQKAIPNGKISNAAVGNLIKLYGDGAEFDSALHDVQRFAAKRLGAGDSGRGDARFAPTVPETNKALGEGMQMIARAAQGGDLTPAAYDKLAHTWKSIVDFAVAYKGSSVADLTTPAE
jgi:hypothetical protein